MSDGKRTAAPAGVLFVCMGNICRSPTAEAVFRALVAKARLAGHIAVDSAGTHDYQLGQPPDPRARAAARRHGYDLPARRARLVGAHDFTRFDWILAMDRGNLDVLETLRPSDYCGNVGLFLDFAPEVSMREVPDPYTGSEEDFDYVLGLIERGSAALLDTVRVQVLAPQPPQSRGT
jgi:protein-tyrosine phosphatase